MNYISPIANEIAWHHAVEKLLGIELTPRCKYIRTILAELMRMQRSPAQRRRRGARPRRVHGVPVRLQPARDDLRHRRDGLRPAVPPELHARRRPAVRRRRRLGQQGPRLRQGLPEDARRHRAGCSTATASSSTAPRASACCRRKTAINLSCTGPIARASGVVRDLRKDEPYLAYHGLRFQGRSAPRTATATPAISSAWRRCCESLKIIEQAIENLPAGPVNVDVDSKAVHARTSRRSIAASRG